MLNTLQAPCDERCKRTWSLFDQPAMVLTLTLDYSLRKQKLSALMMRKYFLKCIWVIWLWYKACLPSDWVAYCFRAKSHVLCGVSFAPEWSSTNRILLIRDWVKIGLVNRRLRLIWYPPCCVCVRLDEHQLHNDRQIIAKESRKLYLAEARTSANDWALSHVLNSREGYANLLLSAYANRRHLFSATAIVSSLQQTIINWFMSDLLSLRTFL